MFRISNIPWANWNLYMEGGGLQGEEIVKSTLFCKVHYVLNSDIKYQIEVKPNIFFVIMSGGNILFSALNFKCTVFTPP